MYALLSFLGEKMALIETSQNLIYCLEIIQCTHFLALTRNPQILPCFSFRRSPRQSFLLHWAPFLGVSSLSHHMSGLWNSGRKTTSKTLKSMLTYFARIWGQDALDLPLCKVQAPCFVLREVAPTPPPQIIHSAQGGFQTLDQAWPMANLHSSWFHQLCRKNESPPPTLSSCLQRGGLRSHGPVSWLSCSYLMMAAGLRTMLVTYNCPCITAQHHRAHHFFLSTIELVKDDECTLSWLCGLVSQEFPHANRDGVRGGGKGGIMVPWVALKNCWFVVGRAWEQPERGAE